MQIPSPRRNCIFVALRAQDTRNPISFSLLDDFLLDLGNGPGIDIEISISWLLGACILGLTHVVNFSIAPSIGLLSSFICIPSNPRSRAWHTSAQESPSST